MWSFIPKSNNFAEVIEEAKKYLNREDVKHVAPCAYNAKYWYIYV